MKCSADLVELSLENLAGFSLDNLVKFTPDNLDIVLIICDKLLSFGKIKGKSEIKVLFTLDCLYLSSDERCYIFYLFFFYYLCEHLIVVSFVLGKFLKK